MKDFNELLRQTEGRRIEFKASLPSNADIAKTAVAFANDAGGEIFIGVSDKPRKIVGIEENDLFRMEEQVSNAIYDRCYPAILPEISFITVEDKHLLRVLIYRGNQPPYHLKSEGKRNGTYIRVGSSNRLADEEIILDLERRRRNISFDSEILLEKTLSELNYDSFKRLFKDKTQENLDIPTLRKLNLVKESQGSLYPTNALVLLSDDSIRSEFFPNAKIECARFKGTSSEVFIDQKTIEMNVAEQAEAAYDFVLRHINQAAWYEEGSIYTKRRWEYPINAIREVIRNAVVHRNYALSGKDIKVAIYDDMVEVTSPGLLPPSIDYAMMESRQSDAPNKVLAPVFKHLGMIDQWGNGLKLISAELKEYPNVNLVWKNVGMSFQVQFIFKGADLNEFVRGAVKDDVKGDVKGDVKDDVKDDVKGEGKGEGKGEEMFVLSESDRSVISLIMGNSQITSKDICQRLSISKSTCERILSKLHKIGILTRQGGRKNGYWVINEPK